MKIRFAASLAALALPLLALAAAPSVPPPDCHPPKPPPKQGASAPQIDAYNNALPKYRTCIQDYVNQRTADAQKYGDLANANSKAATAAVEQFNAFVKKASGG